MYLTLNVYTLKSCFCIKFMGLVLYTTSRYSGFGRAGWPDGYRLCTNKSPVILLFSTTKLQSKTTKPQGYINTRLSFE
ncbi:hypothetical protein ACH3XW_6675 [Acanthocheilonema viteae]